MAATEPQNQTTAPSPPNSSDIQVEQDVDASIDATSTVEVGASVTYTSTKAPVIPDPLPTAYGFGATCLLSRNNGLLTPLEHTNMHNVKFSSSSQVDFNFTSSVSVPFFAGGRGFPEKDSDGTMRNSDARKSGSLEAADRSLPTSCSDEHTASSTPAPKNAEKEEDLDSRLTSGFLTPLHVAAKNGNERIVRMLLQYNVDCDEPDSEGLTALIHATISGHEDVVSVLLAHGAQIGRVGSHRRSVLHWAVLHRRGSILKALLNHCEDDQIDCCDSDGMTPLLKAIDIDFESGVELLLHGGANVHYKMKKSAV